MLKHGGTRKFTLTKVSDKSLSRIDFNINALKKP